MNATAYPPTTAGPALELGQLGAMIWRRKWIVIGAVAFTILLALAAGFLMSPVYRAKTLLAPAEPVEGMGGLGSLLGQASGLAGLVGLDLARNDSSDEALALLKSRQFTEQFILEQGILAKLLGEDWSEAKIVPERGRDERYWLGRAYRIFDQDVRQAFEDRRTRLVTVQIDWRDNEEAARWANELVRQANIWMRSRAIAEADLLIKELQAQALKSDIVPLREAIYRLVENEVKRRAVASVRSEYAFRVVDPAYAPNRDDPVRPKPLLYLIAAPFVGLVLGLFAVVLVEAIRGPPAHGRRTAHS